MPLILPTTIVPASEQNPRVLLIYGPPKVGKTEMLSKLEGCLDIDCERGSDYFNMLKISVNTVQEFCEVLGEVYKLPPEKKYKYIAIDTIDKMEEWAEQVATEKYRRSTVGKNFEGQSVLELPKGGGYFWLRTEFNRLFDMVVQACPYVIFVGHIRDKSLVPGDKILDKDGTFKEVKLSEVTSKDLDLTGKCKSIACSKADAVGHIFRDAGNNLCISFAGSESVLCGSRCSHLKGKTMLFDWNNIYI